MQKRVLAPLRKRICYWLAARSRNRVPARVPAERERNRVLVPGLLFKPAERERNRVLVPGLLFKPADRERNRVLVPSPKAQVAYFLGNKFQKLPKFFGKIRTFHTEPYGLECLVGQGFWRVFVPAF